MQENLAIKITLKSLLSFTLPSIGLMIFMSMYSMVDGVFVARFLGTNALSAINITWPVLQIILAIGLMFGAGGSAICARKLGQGRQEKAKKAFTLIVITAFVFAVSFSVMTLLFLKQIIYALGATSEIYDLCETYLKVFLFCSPAFILQMLCQFFIITTGNPKHAFNMTFIGGITNIVLDYVLIVVFPLGIIGAAIATVLGALFAGLYGLFFFLFSKNIPLTFTKPTFQKHVILSCIINGSSEMVTNISGAITVYLFNLATLRLAGVEGVAAITIILYAQFMMLAFFMGYSNGAAPLISFNYGERNVLKLRKIFNRSMKLIFGISVLSYLLIHFKAQGLVDFFAKDDESVRLLAFNGLKMFSISFLFVGFNIFASALFTAFSNGKVSAFLSFLRNLVFIVAALVCLPKIYGINGVWIAVPVAEVLSLFVTVICLKKYRKVYHY